MRVASEALPDMTALDVENEHYDSKSTLDKPIWTTRIMEFVEKFQQPMTLTDIKNDPELVDMVVVQRGSRLSIQPVAEKHFKHILAYVRGKH